MTIPPPLLPAEGLLWLRAAWAYFRADPMRWLAITATFLMGTQLLAAIPAGVVIAFMLKPIVSVGFLAGAWHQERSQRPELVHLLFGFRANWKALLPLGVVYLLGIALAVALASSISGVALDKELLAGKPLTPEMLKKLQTGMLWAVVFMLPVTLALWFSPALIVFDDVSFSRALSVSLNACWRNLGAILVYVLGVFAIAMLLSLLVVIASKVVGSASQLLMFAATLPLMAVMTIADYVSYRRVFHRDSPLRVPMKA